MYQTPLFTSNKRTIDFEQTAIDIMEHIPENRLLNVRFDRGQGKTTALTTLAYLGAKYSLFDNIVYLAPVLEWTYEFPRKFREILAKQEEDQSSYREYSKQSIEFNRCKLHAISYRSFGRGFRLGPSGLALIDEVNQLNENLYQELAYQLQQATVITATTGEQKYFLSP